MARPSARFSGTWPPCYARERSPLKGNDAYSPFGNAGLPSARQTAAPAGEENAVMTLLQQQPRPRAGDRVHLMSGQLLGTVANCGVDGFKVDLPDGTSLWLRSDAIFTADLGKLKLVCERRGLSAYKA